MEKKKVFKIKVKPKRKRVESIDFSKQKVFQATKEGVQVGDSKYEVTVVREKGDYVINLPQPLVKEYIKRWKGVRVSINDGFVFKGFSWCCDSGQLEITLTSVFSNEGVQPEVEKHGQYYKVRIPASALWALRFRERKGVAEIIERADRTCYVRIKVFGTEKLCENVLSSLSFQKERNKDSP